MTVGELKETVGVVPNLVALVTEVTGRETKALVWVVSVLVFRSEVDLVTAAVDVLFIVVVVVVVVVYSDFVVTEGCTDVGIGIEPTTITSTKILFMKTNTESWLALVG